MIIKKCINAFNALEEFAQDNWDEVGNLVKYILDNKKDIVFDNYICDMYPCGVDHFLFKEYCCCHANEIINNLKKRG